MEDGRWMASEVAYDAIVLDVGLPDGDGIDLCAALRDGGVWAPILILTAHGEVRDRIRGLDAGADDYLAKPFSTDELIRPAAGPASPRPDGAAHGPGRRLDAPRSGRETGDGGWPPAAYRRQTLRHPGAAGSSPGPAGDPRGDDGPRLGLGLGRRLQRHRRAHFGASATLREAPGGPTIETVRGAGFLLHAGANDQAGSST